MKNKKDRLIASKKEQILVLESLASLNLDNGRDGPPHAGTDRPTSLTKVPGIPKEP